MRRLFLVIIGMIFLVLSTGFVFAIDDLIALQGNVQQAGIDLSAGNLSVAIYDAYSGGNLIYNSTTDYNGAIAGGKYDVMLGNGSNELSLEYGQFYYLEMYVNAEKFSFNGSDRQVFQSSTGLINASQINPQQINSSHLVLNIDLSNATNIQSSVVNKTTGTNWLGQMLDTILDTIYDTFTAVRVNIAGNRTESETNLRTDIQGNRTDLINIISSNKTAIESTINSNYTEIMNNNETWSSVTNSSYLTSAGIEGKFNSTSWNRSGTNIFQANLGDSVGIGTSSPSELLNIVGSGTAGRLIGLQSNDTTGYSGIHFRNSTGDLMGHMGYGNIETTHFPDQFYFGSIAAKDFVISTTDTARITIKAGGNVGIGTTGPTQKLEVRGIGNFSETIYINNATDISVWMYNMTDGATNSSYEYWTNGSLTSTYNETYAPWAYNMSDGSTNTTYAPWAYNQSDGATNSSYMTSTYNETYAIWSYNMTTGTYNETYANFVSNESNLNVNSSEYWDNLGSLNATQMENSGNELNIKTSWLSSLYYIKSLLYNRTHIDTIISGNRTESETNIKSWIGSNRTESETNIYSNLDGNKSAIESTINSNYTEIMNNNETWESVTNSSYLTSAGIEGKFNSTSWNRSGTNIFPANLGDSVGIGTATPSTQLNLYRNDTVTIPQLTLEQDGTGDAGLRFLAGGNAWSMGIDNSIEDQFAIQNVDYGTDSANLFAIKQNGDVTIKNNLGIGTTGPTETLSVIGTLNISNSSGTLGLFQSATGKVGIGTSSPGAKLQVKTGTGSGFSGSYNARTSAVFENSLAQGTVISIMAPSTGYSGIFFGDETEEGTGQIQFIHTTNKMQFYVASGTKMTIQQDGNVGIGTEAPSYKLEVNGSGALLNIKNDTNSFLFVNETTGRVGIGTSSPQQTLNVVGDANITGALYVGGKPIASGANVSGGGTANYLAKFVSGAEIRDSSISDDGTDVTVAANLLPSDNSKNLGSAANFWKYLYVDEIYANQIAGGALNLSGTNASTFTINTDNPTNDTDDMNLVFELGTPATNAVMKWDATNKYFNFNQKVDIEKNLSVGGTDLFVDVDGGRVGIGTTGPTETLSVIGTMNVSNATGTLGLYQSATGKVGIGTTASGGKLQVGTYGTRTAPTYSTANGDGLIFDFFNIGNPYTRFGNIVSSGGDASEARLSFYTKAASANPTEKVTILGDGNVGIGTEAPSYKLEVNGSGALLNIKNDTNSFLFVNETTGRVGIGTTGPTSTLSVIGTMNVSNATGTLGLYQDANGRVGIGTDSPTTLLQVGNTTETTKAFGIQIGSESTINLYRSNTNILKSDAWLTSALGLIAPTVQFNTMYPIGDYDLTIQTRSGTSKDIIFKTGSTLIERMRINANGSVGIGTTGPTQKLEVRGIGNFSETIYINNATDISVWMYNMTDGATNSSYEYWTNGSLTSTYNETYAPWAYNMSDGSTNTTYAPWAYNQSDGATNSSYMTSTYNETYAIWSYNMTTGTYNATYANFVSNESNLNVNSSDYWDNIGSLNATQMEDNSGVLNILTSWLESLFYVKNIVSTMISGNKSAIEATINSNVTSIMNNNETWSSVTNSSYFLVIDYSTAFDNNWTSKDYDKWMYNMTDGATNSTYAIYSYNQTLDTYNLWNSVWSSITNNSYQLTTWNKTYADTLYAGIQWGYNMTTGTYNETYASWAYNQSDGATNSSYLTSVGIESLFNSTSWKRSGTNVFLANSGDRVGIGTTAPLTTLNTVGSFNMTNGTNQIYHNDTCVIMTGATSKFSIC